MGAPAARITAADFLTPPELRGLRLAAGEAGCVGGVRLEFVPGGGGTVLGACYQQVPLRVLPPFRFGAHQPALQYLLNPTAGLMDGDGQLIEITARSGSRVVVVGQSATRIHPCLKGFATQQWRIRVETGAALVVLPGPSIPFQAARYFQQVQVAVEPGARFIWGDVGLAGRYARGGLSERWRFSCFIQQMEVRHAGELVFRDRFAWSGPWDAATTRWHLGQHQAWGSLFARGPIPARERTSAMPQAAWFATPAGDLCVRWQGDPESVTAAVVRAALELAARQSGSESARPWLEGVLGPGHWFSPRPAGSVPRITSRP